MTSTLIRPFRRFCGLFILLALLGAAGAQAAVPAPLRQYLLSLYAATDSPNWSNKTNWDGLAGVVIPDWSAPPGLQTLDEWALALLSLAAAALGSTALRRRQV